MSDVYHLDLQDISTEYLTLLRGEVGDLLPKPRNLRDFSDVEREIPEKPAEWGIKNSKQLFESALTGQQRATAGGTTT
jgi:hypothetical protein